MERSESEASSNFIGPLPRLDDVARESAERVMADYLAKAQKPTILEEANAIVVNGKRQQEYGHPRDDFAKIAALWTGWAKAKGYGIEFAPEDVSDLMIMLKMARLFKTPNHRDSMVDIAGYAECRARVVGVDD